MTAPPWDVIVIGAGPAGSLAAHQLARQGLRLLLVEKRGFPRWKVCGTCLNGVALGALAQAGLPDLVDRLGGVPLTRLHLGLQRHQAELELPLGRSVSRGCLDLALGEAAVAEGVVWRTNTEATVAGPCPGGREVRLHSGAVSERTSARVVLVATGLGSPGLPPAVGIRRRVQPHSRVGAGCRLDTGAGSYGRGTIHMAIGRHGYVGLVRTETGAINLAAAFDRNHLIQTGGAAAAAAGVLAEAGFEPVPEACAASWRATPALTARCWPPVAERLLLLGDAASYVEPFTGEGMGWALLGALAAVPLALQGQGPWSRELERQWVRRQGQLIGSRQRSCRALAFALRRPGLSRWALAAVERWPSLAAPFLHAFDGAGLKTLVPEPCP
ncbi:NAD(P)/FAD-dependent oxidoreductase [Cyanobium gracile]|uniref:Flavin-dependent dehydrogenase n=1 Tax=Cyanobium gracile (strain ATCC 27147 / PCC 6307) TaxID=292564 RepID=K9P3M6_CYAGP|nr:NAD(P)/FAD-dependent oxidoreductase [Cyanobium gracile]AFY27695.1 flavin-dependent dehydrogenase [Cyanobium gracile PCC 6307]